MFDFLIFDYYLLFDFCNLIFTKASYIDIGSHFDIIFIPQQYLINTDRIHF